MLSLTLCYEVFLIGVDPFNSFKVWLPLSHSLDSTIAIDLAIGTVCQSIGRLLGLQQHAAKHATFFSDVFGQGPSVDSVHGGYTLFLQPCSE